ncbi:oocyte zinc finger protein XlCOF6-like [Diachasmimorpha longicaudata]|uniref:oocyte zinc finger protein XlCOF6-like n=1 Tax=Diachasmimorpha longicaudata TaxID=58733 RepID=UPI0030B8E016
MADMEEFIESFQWTQRTPRWYGPPRTPQNSPEDLSITGLKWAAAWQRWSVPSIMWRSGGGLSKNFSGSGSPGNPEGFNCPACGRIYKLKSSLRNHQKWECGFFASINWNSDGSRRRNNTIADVPAPLAPQRRPRLHLPTRHVSRNNNRPLTISAHDRRHDCSRCGKSYKNAYILKRHLLYECDVDPGGPRGSKKRRAKISRGKFVCECGKRYMIKGSLERHRRYECGTLPLFSCPKCYRLFKHRHHVLSHLKKTCSKVTQKTDWTYMDLSWINHHYRPPMKKPFICNICGKSYMWRESLQKHQRVECGKLPSIPCPRPGQGIRIHNNRTRPMWRPFSCHLCGKSYTRKDTLRRHLRYECYKKPQFICPICNKASTQRSNLQRHCKTIHGIDLSQLHDARFRRP